MGKRSAATQAGPKPKKQHVEKDKSAPKQRARPVTAPIVLDNAQSDPESELEENNSIEAEEQEQENSGPTQTVPKDPNAARESHKAQKVVHEQRRAAKPHSSLLVETKRIWSLLRQKNIPTAERQKYVHELMDVIRGKVKDIVFKHDASRIVQSVVKYGGQKERDEIAVELKGKFKELAQNKYSKFLVTKLIRLCPTHRASILLEFQSSVMRLLLHREASSVLADAFELYANAYEKTLLVRDLYGKETALFSVTIGSSEDKERAKKGLGGVLEGVDGERRRRVLNSLKESLTSIFNNPDKGAITHAIVHRALWEYLSALNEIEDQAEQDKLRRDMFESCQELLAEMVHTKDGSRVVREFIAQGTAKDRKQILKTLKPHIERICLDDEAQLVLFTALDIIDDTKLVAKSIISEITNVAPKLYLTPQGRRSLFYLLVPRTRRHFMPAQIAMLAETDVVRARTSKKEAAARADEVRKAASAALIEWVERSGGDVVREPGGCLVVGEIMLHADGDKSDATETLLKSLAAPYPTPDPTSSHPHLVDLSHASRLYKTLLQGGHFNRTTNLVERVPQSTWDAAQFALAFVKHVGRETAVAMCTLGERNGSFLVAELCEALKASSSDGGEEGESLQKEQEQARKEVKSWFAKDVKKVIEEGKGKGKNLLLEKIAGL